MLAVLGPTNTGKTHFAMERLLAHRSGIIGFPLRLLARENYERAVAVKGAGKVALITGEEKILPSGAQYFLCTVESMPLDRRVAFLAVDEIQMCADLERGHVFTARLLHARGDAETMFMGAETIRPLIRQLIPEAEFDQRPRFSTLSYSGERKINRLPPQSVVVAFSASDVYAIAEQVRRHRGGAAVVMGALSPRTRNAQVAMYQAGEVDHLVATDAIGMGLNMDVDHVAFAATRKFDGKRSRPLNAPELAQIAGRAGRHMNDGTFGLTADATPITPEMIEDIEQHRFRPIKLINWRNPEPDMNSLETLTRSLSKPPDLPGLIRGAIADDEAALALLAHDKSIADMACDPNAVALLWEVCQIPDFRKVLSDAHASLLGRIYRHLMTNNGRGKLPTDWVADHVQRIERCDGNIDTLTGRLANIRTWTYVAHRGDWLDDAAHWQERTRAIEDKLSDALHERLTQRFVDQRAAVLVKRLRDPDSMLAAISRNGTVMVEGHDIGRLEGFRFIADDPRQAGTATGAAEKSILQAARRALGPEIEKRVRRLETSPDEKISLSQDNIVCFAGADIARLKRGSEVLMPDIDPLASELLDTAMGERIAKRLKIWFVRHLEKHLKPLLCARRAELTGASRGLVFQMAENLGSLPRKAAIEQIEALKRDERKRLKALGVVIGRTSVYLPGLLKPAPTRILGLLWVLWNNPQSAPTAPHPGRVSLPSSDFPPGYLNAIGYRPAGRLALRLDILERIAAHAWRLGRKGPFLADSHFLSLAGCATQDLDPILKETGFRKTKKTEAGVYYAVERKRSKPPTPKKDDKVSKPEGTKKAKTRKKARKEPEIDPHSPFAILKELTLQR
ncbi:MAG: disulfide oxidoreductase [Rhodospirillales bacterium]|nr:disulfide oxidoreductase [Rhodospirillales bacterium]